VAGGPAPLPVAVLTPAAEQIESNLCTFSVDVDGCTVLPKTRACKCNSFSAAKLQPSFAGADADGHLVIINCADRTCSAVSKDAGRNVAKVIAMAGQDVIFTCIDHFVWHFDTAAAITSSGRNKRLRLLGTAKESGGHVVGCFSAFTKAAFVTATESKECVCTVVDLPVVPLEQAMHSAAETNLSAPPHIICCVAESLTTGTTTMFAAGTELTVLEAGCRNASRVRTVFTSTTSSIHQVAVARDGLQCFLDNGNVCKIEPESMRPSLCHTSALALGDSGIIHTKDL